MKKTLLVIFLFIINLSLYAQRDTINMLGALPQKDNSRIATASVTIYPIPVKNNSFTIKTDTDISFVKITNIIGQDIYRLKYNDPQQLIKIILDNPRRGMYLVTLMFTDGTRVVKKILIEQSE